MILQVDIQTPAEFPYDWTPKIYTDQTPNLRRYDWMSRVSHCQVKTFCLEKPGFVFQSAGKKVPRHISTPKKMKK